MTATPLRPPSRVRAVGRLGREVVGYAVVNRSWWLVPVAVVLALFVAFLTAGHAAVPYTIYTLL